MAIVDYLYYRDGSNTGKIALFDSADVLRKLFKTPIFERWGKQFCLN